MQHCGQTVIPHRVLPDGCADILFTAGSGTVTLQLVGAMTRFEEFPIVPGQVTVGLRFHPGMWAAQIGIPAERITDQAPALEELWGKRARTLLDQLSDSVTLQDCAAVLAGSIKSNHSLTPVQRALAWMRRRKGLVSLDEVANQTKLSPRQFRRLCLKESGLSPKLLARILRFRHATSKVWSDRGDYAGLAADCGYFDQSHFIADFQRFSGQTPAAFSRP